MLLHEWYLFFGYLETLCWTYILSNMFLEKNMFKQDIYNV